MELNRRDVLGLISSSALYALLPTPVKGFSEQAAGITPGKDGWEKATCRFCGVGCGVLARADADGNIAEVVGDAANPVNRGMLCIKGYSLPMIATGEDRLTTPLIRKNGKLEPATWDEALDLVAAKFKETLAKHGPTAVAMYGSGQWSITDGYAALKWFKAGMGSNNLEGNSRLCMASAQFGLMTSFGSDEPMGCYDDFDVCDAAVLWGNNMAENHPVLFSRLLANKGGRPDSVRIVELATRDTPTTPFCDQSFRFAPQSDLAIANGILHLLVRRGQVDREFVARHTVIKRGREKPGYGLEDGFSFKDEPTPATWEEYVRFLDDYTPERVAQISGMAAADLEKLADLYGDPKVRVVSLWCMGVNQHTRGTWMNNLIYNLHLVTGKIGTPGSTPFSLTGQPSACGTVREVGTQAHRLPADMVVTNPEHRAKAAKIWKVPVERINPTPGYHTVEMFRALDRGDVKALWVQVTNPFASLPNAGRYIAGAKKEGRFLVVSDVYPTTTTELADVVLPSAMWIEREGLFGNSERRTQHWKRIAAPPAGCLPDDWQIIEVARRMGYGDLFPKAKDGYVRALYEEYRSFTLGTGKDLASYDDLVKSRGLRWPVVDGKETARRYVEGSDPYVKPGEKLRFYKGEGGRAAVVWARPYEPPAESPDAAYPFWLTTGRVLEHWHTGSLTRRMPRLHRAVPEGFVEMHPEDALALGLRDGDAVRLTSRRGELVLPYRREAKGKPAKGTVFVPFFDEGKLANVLTLDAYCPLSAQPDYKKCAVKLAKIAAKGEGDEEG